MLVEILVVVLILGILAALFLPSLLSQKGKAVDAQAKALVRAAQSTTETLATDNNGAYEKVSTVELNKLEPAVRIAASATDAYLSTASGGKADYTLTAKATNGDEFTLNRTAAGEITRECVSPLTKTGCSGGEKGTW
jgi:type IV pilus assembly protein PilA